MSLLEVPVCALRAVVELRDRQRTESAQALASERRQRDIQAEALAAAEQRRLSVPTCAPTADMLDVYERAARAADMQVHQAREALVKCDRAVDLHVDAHRLRCLQHQSLVRIVDRRAEDARQLERRRERRTTDDMVRRQMPT